MARTVAVSSVPIAVLAVVMLGCSSPTDETPNEPGDSLSAVIGPEGGALTASLVDGSSVQLQIPSDALLVETEITLTPLPQDAGSWARVEVAPAGLKFRKPVEIVATRGPRGAIGALDVVQFEFGERSIPLASELDAAASTLSAQTMRLGYALDEGPADDLRRQALGRGNVVRLSEMDCAARLQSAGDTLDELVAQPGLEDLAIALYDTQLSILSDLNCSLEDAVRSTIGLVACSHYDQAVELASLTLPTSEQEFATIVRPILHWTAEARAAGMDCTEDFAMVLEREGDEIVAHYDSQLDVRTSNSWVMVRQDAAAMFSMWM